MTPEQKQQRIDLLEQTLTVINGQGFAVRKAAEIVASDLEDVYINDPDIRWLHIHQHALLLHTEIRLLAAVRANEVNETINHLKGE